MPRCMMCGEKSALLKVTGSGLCCACELERIVYENGGFYMSKVYHAYLPNNFIFFLAIDDKNKQFAISVQSASKAFGVYFFEYADLIDFEYYENKTISNVYNSMMISIYLNSLRRPQVSFYIVNSPTQFGSKQYNHSIRTVKEMMGLLHFIRHNGRQQNETADRRQGLIGNAMDIVKISP